MKRPALVIAGAVGVLAAVFVAILATRAPAANKVAESPLTGKQAPKVGGVALDGSTVRLDQFRGRYVVLNFFATWCVPCQRENPELQRFNNRHLATGDVQVVQVIFDDEVSAVRGFVKKNGVDWPVLEDRSGKVALDFGVRGPPESFLIDPDGFVLARIVGEVDQPGLDDLVAQAKRGRRK